MAVILRNKKIKTLMLAVRNHDPFSQRFWIARVLPDFSIHSFLLHPLQAEKVSGEMHSHGPVQTKRV